MSESRIFASIISADQAELGSAVERLLAAGVDGLHLDVSDGVFVPDLTFGLRTVRAIRSRTDALLDVHLMVVRPEDYLPGLADAGANRVCFHLEAAPYPWRLVSLARSFGLEIGVALNPATPIEVLYTIAPSIDFVNLLTTEPDFSGENVLPGMAERVERARRELQGTVRVQVDGGIDRETAAEFRAADDVVVGRGICSRDDWGAAVTELRELLGVPVR